MGGFKLDGNRWFELVASRIISWLRIGKKKIILEFIKR